MIRLAWYLAACAVLAVVLWLMATWKSELVMLALWALAWAAAVVVNWKVAQRDGRNPIAWVAAAVLVGPLAWVAIAIPRTEASRWGRPGEDHDPPDGSRTEERDAASDRSGSGARGSG